MAEATPGDHLQTGWNLWLFGHQLEHLHAPWRDPYSFRPELSPRANFQGLVFGLPYWPLFALLGAVLAWNVFTLLTYTAAGGATCAWLRSLGLPRGASLVGGLAFALAPYRVAQSTGHLLGPISLFLPLSLLAIEKRKPFWAAAAITAIPLSGQASLALGAVPFFFAYAFVRGRGLIDAIPGTVTALAAAELFQRYAIRGSLHEHGRTLREVGHYSADWIGFVSRHGHGEAFVFLGWLTPLRRARGARAAPAFRALRARGAARRGRRRPCRDRARYEPADVPARPPRRSRTSTSRASRSGCCRSRASRSRRSSRSRSRARGRG